MSPPELAASELRVRGIEGIRPAVLAERHRDALDEIRRFRHFFRHAYALDLKYDKLRRGLVAVLARASLVNDDLARFAEYLRRLIADIEKPAGR